MSSQGMNRREFLKLAASGSLVAGASALGTGVMVPSGLWAAAPKIKGPIKVGYQAILSGPLAGYGEMHKMGAQLAVEEINAKGGIAGVKVEMEFRDSTTKTDDAIKNARYFVDSWGADYLAGVDSSGQALALAPVIEKLDRVLMFTHAATEKVTEEWVFKKGVKQIFRICNSTYHDGYSAAFLAKDLSAMNWSTVSPKYEYGFTCWKMFQDTLKKVKPGVSFVAESFSPFGTTTDFRPFMNSVLDTKAEGLYSTIWGGELVTFVKQGKQVGLFEKIKQVIFPVGAAMDVLEGLGQEMPDNIWISGRYFFLYPNNKENNEWVARFRKRWNHFPAYVSETGYSSIYALKAAVEKSGSKETKALISALEGMEMNSPAGPRVFRKEDHQAMYDVPWGKTKGDSKYPTIKIMGEMKLIPAKTYFARPPFEGAGSMPPF
jgi:branched-chain amino acid transport system substrate-binding protein